MSKIHKTQTNGTGGELAPSMYGRTDTNRFSNGAKRLVNFGIRPQGGWYFRRGSQYIQTTKTAGKSVILKAFEFNELNSYLLEIGENYIRIYKDRKPCLYTTGPNIGQQVEVVTPYLESELADLYFAQSGNILFICSSNHQTRQFTRIDDNTWNLDLFENRDGPYLDQTEAEKQITLRVVNPQSRATLTSTDSEDFDFVKIGDYVEYYEGKFLVLGRIIEKISSSQVIVFPIDNVIDYNSIESTASLEYASSNAEFPNRIRSNTAIWSIELQYSYLKVDDIWYRLGENIIENESVPGSGTKQEYGADVIEVKEQLALQAQTRTINTLSSIQRATNSSIRTCEATFTAHGYTLGETVIITGASEDYYNGLHTIVSLTSTSISYEISNAVSGLGSAAHTATGSPLAVYNPGFVKVPFGSISVTNENITAVISATSNAFQAPQDIGRHIRLDFSGEKVWAKIDTIYSASEVGVTLNRTVPKNPLDPAKFLNNSKTRVWQLGAWYTGNWPSCLTFDNDRLVFGATEKESIKYWYSVTEDYNNFAPTNSKGEVVDTNGITRNINSRKISNIAWLESGPVLLIGTIGAEYQTKPSSLSDGLAPTNIRTTAQTPYGSADKIPPVRVGTHTLFLQRGRNKLRGLVYNFNIDQFEAANLAIFSEHIFEQQNGAKSMAHRQEPISELWFATEDGNPVFCVFEHEHNVNAFGNIKMGGSFSGGNAVVEHIEVVTSEKEDEVYLVVKRTINNIEVRHIEVIRGQFKAYNSLIDPSDFLTTPQIKELRYLDAHLLYPNDDHILTTPGATYNDPINTLGGLTHLAGETVTIVADGILRGKFIVSVEGEVTFTGNAANTVIVGLPYTGELEVLPIFTENQLGSTIGKKKKILDLTFNLIDSFLIKYRVDRFALQTHEFTKVTDSLTQLKFPFTGQQEEKVESGFRNETTYSIIHDVPYPLEITSITANVEISD